MKEIFRRYWKYIVLFFVLGIVVASYYFYKYNQKVSQEQKNDPNTPFVAQDYAPISNDTNSNNNSGEAAQSEVVYNRTLEVSDKKLVIDSLNISAPITLNVDAANQEEYLKSLENGVAHMAKTALPGGSGNVVIFGHSSYYRNKPGSYKTVFTKLNALKNGDIIKIVSSNGSVISYRMTSSIIVAPQDVSVIDQNKNKNELTLITCWPPKTTNQRYIVRAELTE